MKEGRHRLDLVGFWEERRSRKRVVYCVASLLEVSMGWSLAIPVACLALIALIALYVPTVYIRKTNKTLSLLEQIAANTRK
jgi:hypothetical protein